MNDTMEEVLNRLLEISIYAAVLFLAILAVKTIFRKQMSPVLHFFIWFLLIARLCIPITFDSGFAFFVIQEPAPAITTEVPETLSGQDAGSFSILNSGENNGGIEKTASQLEPDQPNTTLPQMNESLNALQPSALPGWPDILLAVWITGILIQAIRIIVAAARMNRMILMLGMNPDKYINTIINKCRAELGIKKTIPVYLLSNIATPALTIGLSPKMILPGDMTGSLSDSQIAFAIKHELMHYKRKDHIVSIVLRLLEAVYWFQPIVWLMNKQIVADMETACDSMVVRTMDRQSKKQYVLTLVQMFAQRKTPQYLLGMALRNSEKIAEKRIRGVYMKSRSKRGVKLIAVLLSVALFVCCFTTACQPTPAEPIVVNKNDGSLQKTISEQKTSAIPDYEYQAPENWAETFTSENGLLHVDMDAEITLPDTKKFPVFKVTPAEITGDMVKKYTDVLFQGKTAYNAKPFDLTTQEDLLKRNQEIMQYLADLKEAYPDQYEKEASGWQAEINKNNEMMQSLPPSYEYTPADFNFSSNQFNEMMLNLETDMGRDKMASLQFYKVESNKRNAVGFDNRYMDEYSEGSLHGISQAKGVGFTPEEAVQMGYDLMEQLGIRDMGLDIAVVRPWGVHFPHVGPLPAYEDSEMFYQIYYTRKLDGLNWTHTDVSDIRMQLQKGQWSGANPELYLEKWEDEYISVCVDKDGVFSYSYHCPAEVKEKVNDNSKLLPFEQIQELFRKQIEIQNSWTNVKSIESLTIYIDSVKLGLAKIKEQNSEGYLLVPAWDFLGHYELKQADGYGDPASTNEDNVFVEPTYYASSFLTLNAIDGSIIDRYEGY